MLLRDPVERLRSQLERMHRTAPNAKLRSMLNVSRSRFDPSLSSSLMGPAAVDNYLIRMLLGQDVFFLPLRAINQSHADEAARVMAAFSAAIPLEELDAAGSRWLRAAFGWKGKPAHLNLHVDELGRPISAEAMRHAVAKQTIKSAGRQDMSTRPGQTNREDGRSSGRRLSARVAAGHRSASSSIPLRSKSSLKPSGYHSSAFSRPQGSESTKGKPPGGPWQQRLSQRSITLLRELNKYDLWLYDKAKRAFRKLALPVTPIIRTKRCTTRDVQCPDILLQRNASAIAVAAYNNRIDKL